MLEERLQIVHAQLVLQMESLDGKITEVKDLRLSTVSGVVNKIMNPARVMLPATVHQFTSDLYFFQVSHVQSLRKCKIFHCK